MITQDIVSRDNDFLISNDTIKELLNEWTKTTICRVWHESVVQWLSEQLTDEFTEMVRDALAITLENGGTIDDVATDIITAALYKDAQK